MPLNSSGPISIGGATAGQSINLEFGRTATQQTSLSQLYRGGGIVGSGAPNVPTSGAISLSQFYGAANRITQTITISSNQTNYVANTAKVTGYQAGLMDVTFVVDSGIAVSSNTTGGFAMDVDTSWNAADIVRIINNGFIVGRGGSGGTGAPIQGQGAPGAAGGPAFRAQRAVEITNNGTFGGGGGGGSGGDGNGSFVSIEGGGTFIGGGGGGGGGGRSSAAANAAGGGAGSGGSTPAQPGGTGTFSGAGGGGAGGSTSGYPSGSPGGNGGGWGSAGLNSGSAGGAGGAAVSGNSNITWVATGTRLGAIT